MNGRRALPFVISRSTDAYSLAEYTTTQVTAHGLLRIDEEHLVIQWRVSRKIAQMGVGYTTTEEHEPIREVSIPLTHLAAASLKRSWWKWGPSPRLVLNAADLRAFEVVAGPEGLSLSHPSQLELQLQRSDADAGREFAAELEMAISDFQLRLAEEASNPMLPPSPPRKSP